MVSAEDLSIGEFIDVEAARQLHCTNRPDFAERMAELYRAHRKRGNAPTWQPSSNSMTRHARRARERRLWHCQRWPARCGSAALVDWVNAAGPFTPDQLRDIRQQVLRLLSNRLRLRSIGRIPPAIAETPIERPIFVVGLPRTGTTLLHSLLAEDPEVHAPQCWHFLSPSPPPGKGRSRPGRIAHAQRRSRTGWISARRKSRCTPISTRAPYQLIEDEEIYCLDFRNVYPYHFYRVPTLAFDVRLERRSAGAFRFHREFLQHLQWNTGKTRWVCKEPERSGFSRRACSRSIPTLYASGPTARWEKSSRPSWR